MKMRPLATLIFLATFSLPAVGTFALPAFADESTTVQTSHNSPAPHDHGDDRPRVEERHEGLHGAELFILGGAFVAALGIAYRVGKISTSRTKKRDSE